MDSNSPGRLRTDLHGLQPPALPREPRDPQERLEPERPHEDERGPMARLAPWSLLTRPREVSGLSLVPRAGVGPKEVHFYGGRQAEKRSPSPWIRNLSNATAQVSEDGPRRGLHRRRLSPLCEPSLARCRSSLTQEDAFSGLLRLDNSPTFLFLQFCPIIIL